MGDTRQRERSDTGEKETANTSRDGETALCQDERPPLIRERKTAECPSSEHQGHHV